MSKLLENLKIDRLGDERNGAVSEGEIRPRGMAAGESADNERRIGIWLGTGRFWLGGDSGLFRSDSSGGLSSSVCFTGRSGALVGILFGVWRRGNPNGNRRQARVQGSAG